MEDYTNERMEFLKDKKIEEFEKFLTESKKETWYRFPFKKLCIIF